MGWKKTKLIWKTITGIFFKKKKILPTEALRPIFPDKDSVIFFSFSQGPFRTLEYSLFDELCVDEIHGQHGQPIDERNRCRGGQPTGHGQPGVPAGCLPGRVTHGHHHCCGMYRSAPFCHFLCAFTVSLRRALKLGMSVCVCEHERRRINYNHITKWKKRLGIILKMNHLKNLLQWWLESTLFLTLDLPCISVSTHACVLLLLVGALSPVNK